MINIVKVALYGYGNVKWKQKKNQQQQNATQVIKLETLMTLKINSLGTEIAYQSGLTFTLRMTNQLGVDSVASC